MKVIIVEDVTREDLVVLLSGVTAQTDKAVKLVQAEPAKETPKQEEAVVEEPKKDKPVKEEKPRQRQHKAEEPKQEEAPKETEKEEATPQVSRTDVINLGKKLVKEGHGKDVSKLMKDTYNATKFSDISDDQLPEVYKAFKEIEDAA